MAYMFDKNLFVTESGSPMRFNIKRCSEVDDLEEYIQHAGGQVDSSVGPYTITFVDEGNKILKDVEVYSSKYITKCCLKNKLFDLNNFRCSSSSIYNEEFNAMDVLQQKMTWDNAKRFINGDQQSKQSSSSVSSGDDDSSQTSSISNGSSRSVKVVLTKSLGPRPSTQYRCEFTTSERKQMVQFLIDRNAYNEVRGAAIWKRMSVKLTNHTWQSLKEHFTKKIMPMIGHYGLSEEQQQRFRKGMNSAPKPAPKPGLYSENDDRIILEYVSKHSKNAQLGGNKFWQEMQVKNTIPGRSWGSVRERYLKHLRGKTYEEEFPPKKTPQKRNMKTIETSSDSDQKEAVQVIEKEKRTSGDEEKEKGTLKRKKKLFTLRHDFESPSTSVPQLSPSSPKYKKPSMLQILINNDAVKRLEARQRKLRALKKQQATSQERDEDLRKVELTNMDNLKRQDKQQNEGPEQSENEQQNTVEQTFDDEMQVEVEQQSKDENLDKDQQQSEDENQDNDLQIQDENLDKDQQLSGDEIEDTDQQLNTDESQDESKQQHEENLHNDTEQLNDDETQYDIQSDTTLDSKLPIRPRKSVNDQHNLYYDENVGSDESDWSTDGLYCLGMVTKRPGNADEEEEPRLEPRQPINVAPTPMSKHSSNVKTSQCITKENNLGPSDFAPHSSLGKKFDFVGDMTLLSQLSENRPTQRSGSQEGFPLSEIVTVQQNNSIEDSQIVVDKSQSILNQHAERDSIIPLTVYQSSGITFNPSLYSTQKNDVSSRDISVQVKEKVNVATQTDPVVVLPLDDSSDENSFELSPKQVKTPKKRLLTYGSRHSNEKKRPTSLKHQNKELFYPPSPVSARLSSPRRMTRSVAKYSDSDDGLSPKFTPPAK